MLHKGWNKRTRVNSSRVVNYKHAASRLHADISWKKMQNRASEQVDAK
jgi:hypothetical protein